MNPDEDRALGYAAEGDEELDAALTAEPRTLAHALADAALSLVPGGGIMAALLKHSHEESLRTAGELVDRAADPSGLEHLLARVEGNEEVAAIFRTAVEAATRTGDKQKRQMLGALVSQAVLDDAKVDESTIFVSMLRNLEGPHLRALVAMDRGDAAGHAIVDQQLKSDKTQITVERVAWIVGREVKRSVGDMPSSLLPVLIREGLAAPLQNATPGPRSIRVSYVSNDGTQWREYSIGGLGRQLLAYASDEPQD